jgi:hypothetical protein
VRSWFGIQETKSDDDVIPSSLRFLRTSSTPYDYDSGDPGLVGLPLTHLHVSLLRLFDPLFYDLAMEDTKARAAITAL